MSTFYSFLRRHRIAVSAVAIVVLVVSAWLLPGNWFEVANGIVLMYTLLVVLAYTDETHKLARQQEEQFRLTHRPWLYVDDIVYESHPTGYKLVILLVNSGNLPAEHEAIVNNISIIPAHGDTPILLEMEKGISHKFVVFPYVQGKEMLYIVPLALSEKQSDYLTEYCSVTISIKLNYRAMNSESSHFPYSFGARLRIRSFNPKTREQNASIEEVTAT